MMQGSKVPMTDIIFSVVMAAYNSQDTIEMALKSIRKQDFPQEQIEILVVDGGSSDNTVAIAEKLGAKVINNPFRLPEPGKTIGIESASGRYVCIMDSDEVIKSKNAFQKRQALFEHNPDVKAIHIAYETPKGMNPCCNYINVIGDPFSGFVYQTFLGGMEAVILRRAKLCNGTDYIAGFGKDDIRPIGDSAVVMDLEYIKDHYEERMKNETTAALFDDIIADTGLVGHVAGDIHLHYSNSAFRTYLKKLQFRVINNIFDVKGSGYAYKAQSCRKLNRRKYLFPFYCISIVFPIIDGIKMAIYNKHWVFLLHIFFSWYVLINVICQYICKFLHINNKNNSYAK